MFSAFNNGYVIPWKWKTKNEAQRIITILPFIYKHDMWSINFYSNIKEKLNKQQINFSQRFICFAWRERVNEANISKYLT